MLKKNEVIDALENGAHISLNEIYRTARVYDAEHEPLGSCRYDTAEKIGKMDGYTDKSAGAWTYTRRIEKDWDAVSKHVQEAQPAKTYTYTEGHAHEETTSAAQAMTWHRMGRRITVWGRRSNGDQYHIRINGAHQETNQEKTDRDNLATCRSIAENLEAYTDGRVYRCPDCGETFELPENVGDKFKCPHCGTVSDVEDLEQLSVWDYMEGVFDIEYRASGRGSDDLRSVCVMVACGGPNIYIDTADAYVRLYWWSDRAEYPISYDARDAVDEWAQEMWDCQ